MTAPNLTPEAAREMRAVSDRIHDHFVPPAGDWSRKTAWEFLEPLLAAQRRAGIQEGLRMAALALCSYCRHIPAQRSPIKGAPRWFHGYPETGGDSCDCPASEVWRAIEERERTEGKGETQP